MKLADRKVIANIVRIQPLLYKLSDKLEKEQEALLGDMCMPAKKVVAALVAIDNRRVDLCNLKVLYGFIEREIGSSVELLSAHGALSALGDGLFDRAETAISRCGYNVERARAEFAYLFDKLKSKRNPAAIKAPTHRLFSCGTCRT